ncbi:unnamed protein product [Pleuronectes platessa]|uniref:Uncharacterized protein n=1 Tax=Pleuronectes platessa TaxID=8262 RepID=A0A9N7U759_PLEPL|nr:unnamed protein product [Pleuronectes platessa]
MRLCPPRILQRLCRDPPSNLNHSGIPATCECHQHQFTHGQGTLAMVELIRNVLPLPAAPPPPKRSDFCGAENVSERRIPAASFMCSTPNTTPHLNPPVGLREPPAAFFICEKQTLHNIRNPIVWTFPRVHQPPSHPLTCTSSIEKPSFTFGKNNTQQIASQ